MNIQKVDTLDLLNNFYTLLKVSFSGRLGKLKDVLVEYHDELDKLNDKYFNLHIDTLNKLKIPNTINNNTENKKPLNK